MSELPTFTIRELLDAGVHFGHKTMRWNPKMAPFLYGKRDDVHIIDLQKTVPLLYSALKAIRDVARENGRILFVGTKRQAAEIVAESAERCGQYYVNHRWLGGMLTNWNTISLSIKRMTQLEGELSNDNAQNPLAEGAITKTRTKKETLEIQRKFDKLQCSLGGISNMGGRPDLIVVVDTNKESLAIQEANKLDIPVVAVLDSNSDPDGITYPIPGNDDATRAIKLYFRLFSDAVLSGLQDGLSASGVDIGESAELPASEEAASEEGEKASESAEASDEEKKAS